MEQIFDYQINYDLIDQAACELLKDQESLDLMLEYCSKYNPRTEGIPALLIIEEYGRPEIKRITAASDSGFGFLHAVLATALTIIVEIKGGDEIYPSICPAMSALADKVFHTAAYAQYRQNIH